MGRKPKCKSCVSYEPQEDGTVLCEYNGRLIDPNGSPMFDGGACYEKKKKKKLTPVELSLIRSSAGRKGGMRPKKKRGRTPKSQMQVNTIDLKVFSAYASRIKQQTIVATFHDNITRQLVSKYPELKPDGWID